MSNYVGKWSRSETLTAYVNTCHNPNGLYLLNYANI